MLIKGPNGWTHKFVKREYADSCKICEEEAYEHYD